MLRPTETRLSSPSISYQSAPGANYIGIGEPPHRTDMCNVVIFGEVGAGKSSLVNLIARTNVAETSHDAKGCTTGINVHEIFIQNETLKIKLFDTPGLDEGPGGAVPDKEARTILKDHIGTLMKQGDIHLIMYCVRGERVIQTLQRNYEFIHSQVKRKVPIVLVVTCLESYEPELEKWWRVNERAISEARMTFAGHACVTTIESVMERRNQSYHAVCKLIEHCRLSNDTKVHNVRSEMAARNNHTNIVLFGQAGAGKSSLVNLMAGKDVASTSNDMKRGMMHWKEYPMEFDGESYKVFDTVGLEAPELGIKQFLDAVENAYKLIQDLERQGGIDLLLFCMRAGRLTTTLQSNYRLFHEFLCDKKVPIVVVITHLENEEGKMDDWWKRNEGVFHDQKVDVASHACITAIAGNSPHQYELSRTTVRNLVKEFATHGQKQAWNGGDNWFVSFMEKLWALLMELVGNGKTTMREDMVSRLTTDCSMSRDVAKKLADRIKP